MADADWETVKELFCEAVNLPSEDRSTFLDKVCSGRPEIRDEIEILLGSYESEFLEQPALVDHAKATLTEVPLFNSGQTISHYRIVRLLGRGGMGEVYLAEDETLDRPVAIKLLHDRFGWDGNASRRLLREARSAARLDHPNICSVYDIGEHEGRAFIVMQFVEGRTLDERLHDGPLTIAESISYVSQIASALEAAHSRGVIHRDIKPSNVILAGAKGHVRVVDFSLAKRAFDSGGFETELSTPGIIAGTTNYMSPEQIRGRELDARTDIWSLGVVFYQMLTGALPFTGESRADVMAAILNEKARPVSAYFTERWPELDAVVARLLSKSRRARFQTISEFENALSDLTSNANQDRFSAIARSDSYRHAAWDEDAKRTAATAAAFSEDADKLSLVTEGSTIQAPRWMKGRAALAAGIGILGLLLGGLAYWKITAGNDSHDPFSAGNAGNLRIATIFGIKRQIGGALTSLSFSPDGRLLLFALSSDGKSTIFIKQPSGGGPMRVTDGKFSDQNPVWSPDGQRIAFISDRDGKMGLWTVSYLGGAPSLLHTLDGTGSNYQLKKWRQDGKAIFFRNGSELREIVTETGEIRDVDLSGIGGSISGDFSISADDSKVLAVSVEHDKEQIWMRSLVTGETRRIAETSYHSWAPTWFPDGRRFAYCSDQNGIFQIYIRNPEELTPKQVTFSNFNSCSPAIAPDGRSIAFTTYTDEANIFTYDIATRSERMFTSNIKMQLFPAISPDGERIAYQITDDGAKLFSSELRVIPTDSEGGPPPVSLNETGCCMKWSPTGEHVAYVKSFGTDHHIWRFGINDQREIRLTQDGISMPGHTIAPFDLSASMFEWSPDGKKIVFTARREGRHNVWTALADGSGEQPLTNFREGEAGGISPMWSPDAAKVAFVEALGQGPSILSKNNRLVFLDGDRYVVGAGFDTEIRLLSWHSDSSGVFVAALGNAYWDVYFVSAVEPGRKDRLNRLANARRNGINISPDQKWISYSERKGDVDNIFLIPVRGGSPTRLTSNDDTTLFFSGLAWTPDSKKLLYSKQTGGIQISLISEN
ncbi:MAG TPA: protein kinase [Pyrinomonadaceae bacterium]|nr:protein kinase [Pyrinomonadaceae bacterium]